MYIELKLGEETMLLIKRARIKKKVKCNKLQNKCRSMKKNQEKKEET
jgi:hypothetical protein